MNIALIAAGMLGNKKESTWLTLFNLAKEYQKQGHYAIIIAKKKLLLPVIETIEGVKIYRLFGDKKISRLTAVSKTIEYIQLEQKVQFDILHGFSSSPLLSFELKLAKKHAPNVKIVHTLKSYSKYPVTDKFSFLLKFADTITVPTAVAGEKVSKLGSKVKVVRSNIDLIKFKPKNRRQLQRKHGFKGKRLIMNYGALRWEKGVDDLIKAMPLVIKEYPNAHLLFAVRSREIQAREKYLAMARELGCGGHISIIFDDVPIEEYVSMAEAMVLAYPTLRGTEGNPSCLLEAMAAKTPVVITSLPEIREIVRDEKEVLMANPSDPFSVAEKIIKILGDQKLQRQLTKNAYLKAQQFGTQKIVGDFLEVYANTN